MDNSSKNYCRLCAELKTIDKMADYSPKALEDIVKKLKLLNLECLDFADINLPKYVCILCSCNINNVICIIKSIQDAQRTLKAIFVSSMGSNHKDEQEDFFSTNIEDDIKESTLNEAKHIGGDFNSLSCNTEVNHYTSHCAKPSKHYNNDADSDDGNLVEDLSEDTTKIYLKSEQEIDNNFHYENSFEEDLSTSSTNVKAKKKQKRKVSSISSKIYKKAIKSEKDSNIIKQEKPSSDKPLFKVSEMQYISWKNFIWVCSACSNQFPSYQELVAHSIDIHNTCGLFKCIYCDKKNCIFSCFIKHVSQHFHQQRHTCFECYESFESKKDYTNHAKSHNTLPYSCTGCNTKFNEKSQLEDHQNKYVKNKKVLKTQKASDTKLSLTCDICKKTYSSRNCIKRHMLLHTGNLMKRFVCDKCGKGFYHKHDFIAHLQTHSDVKQYKCMICNIYVKSLVNLRTHVLSHDSARPYPCETCGKTFRLQRHVTKHALVHSNSFPHVCSFCNKGFKVKYGLTEHMRQHTGIHAYKCEICERTFTNWPNYNLHMRTKHGIDKAKKKRAQDGTFVPIDQATGDVRLELPSQSVNTENWKKSVLELKKGGPRKKSC